MITHILFTKTWKEMQKEKKKETGIDNLQVKKEVIVMTEKKLETHQFTIGLMIPKLEVQ